MEREPQITVRFVLGRARPDERIVPGEAVELDTLAGDPVEVYAGEALVARGEAVWVGGRFGVRVRQVVASAPR